MRRSKKKKKSAAVETNDDANADEDQLENDGSEGDDGSDGEEHDSEHDDDASDGSTGDADAVPWAGTNRDYTYDELVDRIFSILSADRPDLASGGRKKYQVKPPHVVRDGCVASAFRCTRLIYTCAQYEKNAMEQFSRDVSIDESAG